MDASILLVGGGSVVSVTNYSDMRSSRPLSFILFVACCYNSLMIKSLCAWNWIGWIVDR